MSNSEKEELKEIKKKLEKADRLLKNVSIKLHTVYDNYEEDQTFFLVDIEDALQDTLEAKSIVNAVL